MVRTSKDGTLHIIFGKCFNVLETCISGYGLMRYQYKVIFSPVPGLCEALSHR